MGFRKQMKWCDRCDDLTLHMEGQCVGDYWALDVWSHQPLKITCPRCSGKMPLGCFRKKSSNSRRSYCNACATQIGRNYCYSFDGMIHNMYARVKRRCLGKTPDKNYKGLPFLSRKEFLAIAKNDRSLKTLYDGYVENGRIRKLTPSVHRIDPPKGYVPGNIAFITVSENSKEALRCKKLKLPAMRYPCKNPKQHVK